MPATTEQFCGYQVRQHVVSVGPWTFELVGPLSCDALLDDPRVQMRFEQDGYLPYWAELWPAGVVLAREVLRWGPANLLERPPVVLELGCGLGLASLVAVRLGYRVIASDYDEDALAFVVENARRNGLLPPETRYVDWRRSYPDLRVGRIIAGEVLYEERNLRPVAEFVKAHLERRGWAVVCDACRPTADRFEQVARECGLAVHVSFEQTVPAGKQRGLGVRLFRLTHADD